MRTAARVVPCALCVGHDAYIQLAWRTSLCHKPTASHGLRNHLKEDGRRKEPRTNRGTVRVGCERDYRGDIEYLAKSAAVIAISSVVAPVIIATSAFGGSRESSTGVERADIRGKLEIRNTHWVPCEPQCPMSSKSN